MLVSDLRQQLDLGEQPLYFHSAPRARRELILTQGLAPRPRVARRWQIPGQPEGLYVWNNLGSARKWAGARSLIAPLDLWLVRDLQPSQLTEDPLYFDSALVLPAPAQLPPAQLVPLVGYQTARLGTPVIEEDLLEAFLTAEMTCA